MESIGSGDTADWKAHSHGGIRRLHREADYPEEFSGEIHIHVGLGWNSESLRDLVMRGVGSKGRSVSWSP